MPSKYPFAYIEYLFENYSVAHHYLLDTFPSQTIPKNLRGGKAPELLQGQH